MAYSTDLLHLQVGHGPSGIQNWVYGPTTDSAATVRGAGYISDAKARGMRVNDIVTVVDTNTPLTSLSRCSALNSTTGAATLTA